MCFYLNNTGQEKPIFWACDTVPAAVKGVAYLNVYDYQHNRNVNTENGLAAGDRQRQIGEVERDVS